VSARAGQPHPTLWLTERGPRHQQRALEFAPPELSVTVLRQPSRSELFAHLAGVEFIISERTGAIDAALLAAAPQLKMILRLGSLSFDIDLAAAAGRGIVVALHPQRGAILVAEHVMLQMLSLVKRLRELEHVALAAADWGPPRRTDENTFVYNWSRRENIGGLADRTIGVLGFGEIGAELARRLQGWECTVLYHRRRRLPVTVEAQLGVAFAPWDAVLAGSDILVNLLPYFPETDMALDAAAFAAMRRGACLVSCGSGSVIDEAGLAVALRSGHLAGAALDTFEWEPVTADNPLRVLAAENPEANVLLTPHLAGGASSRAAPSSRASEYEPILRFLAGKPVPRRVA
jgi:phosphoglycerate dehydrogenase-like enzyme